MRTQTGEYEFHGANVIGALLICLIFLCLTADTVRRVAAGEDGGWLLYVEPAIFIATARGFLRGGRGYLRERGRAARLLTVSDHLARHYQLLALIIGGLLLAAYGILAAVGGGGLVYFVIKSKLIIFVVGAFVALNAYLDYMARSRMVAVLDESRAHPEVIAARRRTVGEGE